MDIVVVRTDGSWYTRPDITLVRDADRFCLPADCTGALVYKACCIRIEKAGKALEERFCDRYFTSYANAYLLYGVLADGRTTPYLDRATIVAREFQPLAELAPEARATMTRAIVGISQHLSYRIGDFIVFEQEPATPLERGAHFENIDIL